MCFEKGNASLSLNYKACFDKVLAIFAIFTFSLPKSKIKLKTFTITFPLSRLKHICNNPEFPADFKSDQNSKKKVQCQKLFPKRKTA